MPYHLQRFLFGLIFTILSALGMVQAQSFQHGWIKNGRVVASSVSGENTPYKKIGDGLLLAAGKVYLQR